VVHDRAGLRPGECQGYLAEVSEPPRRIRNCLAEGGRPGLNAAGSYLACRASLCLALKAPPFVLRESRNQGPADTPRSPVRGSSPTAGVRTGSHESPHGHPRLSWSRRHSRWRPFCRFARSAAGNTGRSRPRICTASAEVFWNTLRGWRKRMITALAAGAHPCLTIVLKSPERKAMSMRPRSISAMYRSSVILETSMSLGRTRKVINDSSVAFRGGRHADEIRSHRSLKRSLIASPFIQKAAVWSVA